MESKNKVSRRTRLPKYYRSAYKIFAEEKRAEIVSLRSKAFDKLLQCPIGPTQEHGNTSLSYSTVEINQMWEDLSSEGQNKFKVRAMMNTKRQRVVNKKGPTYMTDDTKKKKPSQTCTTKHMDINCLSRDMISDSLEENSRYHPYNFCMDPNPTHLVQVAYKVEGEQQQQPSPTHPSTNKRHEEIAVSASPINELHQLLGAAQSVVFHPSNRLMTLQQPPRNNYGMGSSLNSSYHLGAPPATLTTLAPTVCNSFIGSYTVAPIYSHLGAHGGLITSNYDCYPPPFTHAPSLGHDAPIERYGHLDIPYLSQHSYQPVSYSPYTQPFNYTLTTDYLFQSPSSKSP